MIVNGGFPGGESCNLAAIAWFLINRKRCIYNFHNNARPYRKFIGFFQYSCDRLLCRSIKSFVTVSRSCAQSVQVRSGLKNIPVEVVYNGISKPIIDAHNVFNLVDNITETARKKTIVMLGTFEERKGHEFLFSAMKKLPQYQLIVCGTGTQHEKKRIVELASGVENITLLGFRKDAQSIIATSDLLVVPSKENESFGLTIIEAMSLGTAVIATRVGGMVEVIEHEIDGILVNYGDVNSLCTYITNILEDKSYNQLLIDAARDSFKKKYSSTIMAQNYDKLF
nr:glycosyltransferase family 4 protein [Motilimonas sp. E26]